MFPTIPLADKSFSEARLALNYKGISYDTQWVEYPDIAPLFKSFGIAPNPPDSGNVPYAIPAVRLADGRYVMDSVKIAEALDEQQPLPSLHLTSPRVGQVQKAVKLANEALAPISKPRVPVMLLNSGSLDYFHRTRSKRYGMSLEELARSDLAGEGVWAGAADGLALMRDVLAEDKAGPYVMGQDPGFADFVLAGFWKFMQLLDHDGDLFGRVMEYEESFPKHFAACQKWFEKDA